MVRSGSSRHDDDDEEEEEGRDYEDDEEEPPPRRRGRASSRRSPRRSHPSPVRRWRASAEDEEEEEEEPSSAPGPLPWKKKPIFWRARDSLFFEPLVALAIIVVLLVALFAYTQNWPPIYVVESDSMQHGSSDQLGLINTGDLVLAQKISTSAITTYVMGLQSGYSTYGEYGDVLLYWPNGQGSTPVIHRAILYLEFDPASGTYNATGLGNLPCGTQTNAVYAYIPAGQAPSCATTHLATTGTLDLYHIGWTSLTITISLSSPGLGGHSGFLTMGDNNPFPDQLAPSPISSLVEPGWVVGVARGMIPWFGAIKLLLQGQASEVPPQSWQLMGLTIVGAILVAFAIHYVFRREGIETPLRREEEAEQQAEAEAAAEEEPPESPSRWHWFPFHRRKATSEEDEEEEPEVTRSRRSRPPPSHTSSRRGRPVPHVRRSEKSKKQQDSDDEL